MQDGCGMLEFSVFAHGGGLAVALCVVARDTQSGNCLLRKEFTEFFADGHQLGQILDVLSGARVCDDGHGGGAARGRIHGAVHLGLCFLQKHRDLSNVGLHRNPSSPLISEAFSPPTRAWMRGPVVITSASRISSARGASASPCSISPALPTIAPLP